MDQRTWYALNWALLLVARVPLVLLVKRASINDYTGKWSTELTMRDLYWDEVLARAVVLLAVIVWALL